MLRSREVDQRDALRNWAEFLLDLGRRVRKQIHRRATIGEASRQLGAALDCCRLAVAFVYSSDLTKLQAMVEDWSLERISRELAAAGLICQRSTHSVMPSP